MNENETLTITRDAIDWYVVHDAVSNTMTMAWITNGLEHDHNTNVATVTLTTSQWHAVLVDIAHAVYGYGMGSVDNMARILNTRDAIVFALRYDVRNG